MASESPTRTSEAFPVIPKAVQIATTRAAQASKTRFKPIRSSPLASKSAHANVKSKEEPDLLSAAGESDEFPSPASHSSLGGRSRLRIVSNEDEADSVPSKDVMSASDEDISEVVSVSQIAGGSNISESEPTASEPKPPSPSKRALRPKLKLITSSPPATTTIPASRVPNPPLNAATPAQPPIALEQFPNDEIGELERAVAKQTNALRALQAKLDETDGNVSRFLATMREHLSHGLEEKLNRHTDLVKSYADELSKMHDFKAHALEICDSLVETRTTATQRAWETRATQVRDLATETLAFWEEKRQREDTWRRLETAVGAAIDRATKDHKTKHGEADPLEVTDVSRASTSARGGARFWFAALIALAGVGWGILYT